MKCIDKCVTDMRSLYAQPLDEAERWRRIGPVLKDLLADPELIASAASWPTTQWASNLLFYEDPDYKFVINGLIKAAGSTTPTHDHAHVWVAYGVIEGAEQVMRYNVLSADDQRAELELDSAYLVEPGFVDVVPPHQPHAETSLKRTVSVILRSETVGSFPQRTFNHETGQIIWRTGPKPVPYHLEAA